MQLFIFPGLPKRFSLDVEALLGNSVLTFPREFGDFIEDVHGLVSQKELYTALMGVGQIFRFVPHLANSFTATGIRSTVKHWAENLPPYWKHQIFEHFLFELDDVCRGFREWSVLMQQEKEEIHALTQQHDLALRRDGLEDVCTIATQFYGSFAEFELMRYDVAMRETYTQHRSEWMTLGMASRLRRTKQVFPQAWWVS